MWEPASCWALPNQEQQDQGVKSTPHAHLLPGFWGSQHGVEAGATVEGGPSLQNTKKAHCQSSSTLCTCPDPSSGPTGGLANVPVCKATLPKKGPALTRREMEANGESPMAAPTSATNHWCWPENYNYLGFSFSFCPYFVFYFLTSVGDE
jgi:hypothetical protein